MTTLTELRELEKRATQGEIEFSTERSDYYLTAGGRSILGSDTYYPWVPNRETVEFIAALVNWFRSGALEKLERDAERWNECLRRKQFPGRLGTPINIDGTYMTWTIEEEFYGQTPEDCLDSAIAELRKNRK